ncbi:MAG: KEOPS complex subunit Pcc1 [Thermoplasmata archaeon]
MIYRKRAFPDTMKVSCLIRFAYDSEEEAKNILSSIQTDNEGFVKTHLEGSSLVSEISAESILSLLHTLDDYMSCLTVAEEIIGKKSQADSL